jgi:hypothetical protein
MAVTRSRADDVDVMMVMVAMVAVIMSRAVVIVAVLMLVLCEQIGQIVTVGMAVRVRAAGMLVIEQGGTRSGNGQHEQGRGSRREPNELDANAFHPRSVPSVTTSVTSMTTESIRPRIEATSCEVKALWRQASVPVFSRASGRGALRAPGQPRRAAATAIRSLRGEGAQPRGFELVAGHPCRHVC